MADIAAFAGIGLALYVGHHVGDYWVQTDHQAAHKGKAGHEGAKACLAHVISYVATQAACLALVTLVTGLDTHPLSVFIALLVSGLTHYAADRREYGIMFKLARMIPGKANFMRLGVPRDLQIFAQSPMHNEPRGPVPLDNPSLGTGTWALDQSWHIALGVFVPALIACI